MKKLTFAGLFLIFTFAISALGQVKPGIIVSNHARSLAPREPDASTATRARVLVRNTDPSSASEEIARLNEPGWDDAKLNPAAESSRPRINHPMNPNSSSAVSNAALAPSLTDIYRIGVGDVLDVQLVEDRGNKSTLYTVLEGGVVDYPLASAPIPVAGLTSEEVAVRLREQIKVLENPSVVVKVRDYASHSVTVSGLVGVPGPKVLQREAVPLYVVLSQSLPLAEATGATITRAGGLPFTIELADANASATLLMPGDVIKISAMPVEFFFVGGEINAPGQKPYHTGLTLTQAILASGGLSKNAGTKVKVSRRGTDGLLMMSEYNLDDIQNGKAQDPVLQEGDGLQVEAQR